MKMPVKKHPGIKGVAEEYERISWGEKRRWIADFKEKQRLDRRAMPAYAKDEGREEVLALMEQGYTPEQVKAKPAEVHP
jgi:hypothetical protein